MKRPLPKLPKGLQLALVLCALLFLALSYWQFLGCPRLSAARELRRQRDEAKQAAEREKRLEEQEKQNPGVRQRIFSAMTKSHLCGW